MHYSAGLLPLMAVVLRLLAPGRLPRKVESRAPGFVEITWFWRSAGITEACALRLTLSEMLTDVRCYQPSDRVRLSRIAH